MSILSDFSSKKADALACLSKLDSALDHAGVAEPSHFDNFYYCYTRAHNPHTFDVKVGSSCSPTAATDSTSRMAASQCLPARLPRSDPNSRKTGGIARRTSFALSRWPTSAAGTKD
jgi:hypothetical protein